MKRLHSLLILTALSCAPALTAYAAQFEKVTDLPLPGAPARFDYEALDSASGLALHQPNGGQSGAGLRRAGAAPAIPRLREN